MEENHSNEVYHWYWIFQGNEKNNPGYIEELEGSILIKDAVKWHMEFNVNKCNETHGGAILYNDSLLSFGDCNRLLKILSLNG